jgi:hypothetical protein
LCSRVKTKKEATRRPGVYRFRVYVHYDVFKVIF